jgi:serine/threonine protein phosphatase PrpC
VSHNNKIKISYHSITVKGNIRKKNEDYFLNDKFKDIYSFVLCDGMGGKNGGEIASKIAAHSIISYINQNDKKNVVELFNSSFHYANLNILEEVKKNYLLTGMGTTVVLAILYKNQIYLGHIGDSRIYYISGNKIRKLTKDHSLIQQLVDDGEISPELAVNHPMKNVITHALGSSFRATKNYFDLKIRPKSNSYILLCSDGLNNMIDDEEIVSSFKLIEPDKITDSLIKKALDAGGKDNITTTVIWIEENLEANSNENLSSKLSFLKRLF